MATTKPPLEVVSKPAESPFTTDATDTDPVDVTIQKLRLQGQLRSKGVDVQIARSITDAGGGSNALTDSYTVPPQLTLNVVDRGYRALSSGIFDSPVDIELDGIPMRLMEVQLVAPEILTLLFYHRIVALLLTHRKPLSVSRSKVTRAQFIEMMLREILDEFPDLIFVCPEVNTKEPVASQRKTARSLAAKTLASNIKHPGKAPGFGAGSLRIKSWDGSDVTLGPEQLANAAKVLDTCSQLNAPAKAVLAVCEACIVEGPNFENPAGGTGSSVGIMQNTGGEAWASDVVDSIRHALQDPGATSAGGMISLANAHPQWSAGQVAQAEQGSSYASRYDLAATGARTVIDAYRSAGGFSLAGATSAASRSTTISTYNFTRGQSGQSEDSWTCAQRLAGEVNWRFFVTGRRSVYFVTDDDLINLPSKYLLQPGNEGLGQVTFGLEVGQRTIVRHGRRVPRPSEGQVAARVGRFAAQVGDPISLQGYGDADGDWVLYQVDRDVFDKTATLYFQAPQKPAKEPAPQISTTSAAGLGSITGIAGIHSSNPIDRVYAAAQAMSQKNLPYVYGGGHTGSWSTAVASHGLDCSSSTSIALYQGGLMTGYSGPIVSGDFESWGAAGRGRQMTVWCNGGHVFIQFYGRPAKRFDTVPGGSGGDGPHLRYTAPGDPADTWEASGFISRHAPSL